MSLWGVASVHCRVVVATRPEASKKSRIGRTRQGVVYELFFTQLPQDAFTASDVVMLYLHRGAFEPVLADEDQEQDPDRWCSHSPAGQEAWQIVSQWVWNLRLELGHVLEPTPMRTTEFAPPLKETSAEQMPVQGYGKPSVALPWKAGRFSGQDFAFQPDGALSCPAGKTLRPTEQRREADGSLRMLYSARIRDCRGCPKRPQCQWNGEATTKPRRISILLHPLRVGPAPLLWQDWSRRAHRRACMQLVRHQRIEVSLPPPAAASPRTAEVILSRAASALSPLVDRAAGSQCACSNSWPGHHQTVRGPASLRCLSRSGDSLACCHTAGDSQSPLFGKARFSSPQGASWLLFFPVPLFLPSSLLSAPSLPLALRLRGRPAPVCLALLPSSSSFRFPTSLRNSWVRRCPGYFVHGPLPRPQIGQGFHTKYG